MSEGETNDATRWRVRLDQHPAAERLRNLGASLTSLQEFVPPESISELDRLWKINDLVARRFESSDPQLVTTSMLDRLLPPLDALLAGVEVARTALQGGGQADWAGIGGDDVIDSISPWPPAGEATTTADEARRILERLPAEAAGIMDGVKSSAEASLASIEAKITEIADEAELRRSALQTQVDGLDARVTGQVELIGQQLGRLEGAITSQTTQFADSESQRRSDAAEALEALRTQQANLSEAFKRESEEALAKVVADASEQRASDKDRAEALIANMTELQDMAQKLVGVIGRTGMTGGYEQYADRERGDADRWRKAAIWLGAVAAVVLAGVVVWSGIEHAPSWPVVVGRLLLSGALGGVSAYAARQASEHRKRAETARSLQLALAAIGPYLESVSPTAREKILEAFTFIFFAGGKLDDDSSKAIDGPSFLAALAAVVGKPE